MLSNEIALVAQEVVLVKEGMTKLDEIQNAVGMPVAMAVLDSIDSSLRITITPGTWYQLPGTWHQVPGSLYLVPGTR